MNEQPSSSLPPACQPDELSAGGMLRQLREAAGEDIATLARALKVPEHKLQALEANDHDVFPDVVVMRGIAAGICRHFKANPAPVLALLPNFAPTRLTTDADLNESFNDERQPRFDPQGKVARFKFSPMGIAVGLLLLAAAGIAFLPPWEKDYFRQRQAARQPPADTHSTAVSTVVEPITTTVPREPAQPALAEQPTEPPEPQLIPPPPAQSTVVAETAPATPQANEPAEATATLLLRASATSWVQIRNAEGVSLVQRLLQAGESVTAPGQPPWSVVVGNAAETEVIVRGTPMDIRTKAREGVARFEVK